MERVKIMSPAFGGIEIDAKKYGRRFLVQHSTLEKVAQAHQVCFDMAVVASDEKHAAVVCRHETGIMTIGEATEGSMWTDIDRQYPITIAWNRAFDRAMIRLLSFREEVYSNKEVKEKDLASMEKEKTSKASPVAAGMTQETSVPAPAKEEPITELKEPAVEVAKTPVTAEKKPVVGPQTRILFGRWKGRKFSELETNPDFLKFIDDIKTQKVSFADEKKQEQLDYMLKHIG